ncbi:hypothetical protein EG244_06970 [Falsigemmobacter faecalis]|uniref:Uncharacterized protein n=1 Tax=Falsigemmobacter faecalis TaxID=2488730 RepID=A0A3P3DPN9_9RHOB|nr:hypothetical protein EG244_06970 [Falsigemmobacter faecalis]
MYFLSAIKKIPLNARVTVFRTDVVRRQQITAISVLLRTHARCLIPRIDGVILSREWKDALWDKFVMEAPRSSHGTPLVRVTMARARRPSCYTVIAGRRPARHRFEGGSEGSRS